MAAGADWVTLDECKAKFESGFSGSYWYKNKFSWCRSKQQVYSIIEVPSGRAIADVWHTLTYIGNGGNGQRTLDLHVRISNWEAVVVDPVQWNAIRPGLVFRFFPTCVPTAGSACGDIFPLGLPYVEFPAMATGDRDYWFLPTTSVAAAGDSNPQDLKGYYRFAPLLQIIHATGMVTTSNNALPQDNVRCDSASYGGTATRSARGTRVITRGATGSRATWLPPGRT